MKRTLAVLIAATFVVGAPATALAQDRDRDGDRDRDRRSERRDDRPRRPLSDSIPSGCVVSREYADRVVIRCEVAPGRYVDRVVPK